MSSPTPAPFSEAAPDSPLEQLAYLIINVGLAKEIEKRHDPNNEFQEVEKSTLFNLPFDDPYMGVDVIIGANDTQFLLSYKPDPTTGDIKDPVWITKKGIDGKRKAGWSQLIKKTILAYKAQIEDYDAKFEEGPGAAFFNAFNINFLGSETVLIKKKHDVATPLLSGGEDRAENELRKVKARQQLIDEVLGDLQHTPTARFLLAMSTTIFRDQLEHYKRVFEDDASTMNSMKLARKKGIDEDLWCICRRPDDGRTMIQCDASDCRKWYHLDCVGLEEAPEGIWLCLTCGSD